jgi:myo-inositol-1(or 4)-monophosphatase
MKKIKAKQKPVRTKKAVKKVTKATKKSPVKPAPKPKQKKSVKKPKQSAKVKPVKAKTKAAKPKTVKAKPAKVKATKITPVKAKPAKASVSEKKAPVAAKKQVDVKPPVKTPIPLKPTLVPKRPAVSPTADAQSVRPAPRVSGKPLDREFLFQLAMAIKDAVAPMVKAARGREIVSSAPTGDATFEVDKVAEKALLGFLKNARAPVAYYSEDAGYSTFSNVQPKNLLVVDPIDGTRAAKCGFEACVISIATTRVIERPTMADMDNACVAEIVGDRIFFAERGKGARIYSGEHVKRPKLSSNTNLESLAWSMTVPARPAELIFPTAARLIDLSSLKGGFFACNSSSYSLTRLVTHQLDACVDIAARYMRDIPDIVRDHFINAGRGSVLGIAPYDFAAAVLIAQEAGCVVTDAYGRSFDNVLLLDSTAANHQSLIAAANAELHVKLLNFFDTRMQQFEALLKRRAEQNR